jgi:hypothetical protein
MTPRARSSNLVVEDMRSECVVYDAETKKAHSLNETLIWIWRNCDGFNSVEELTKKFEQYTRRR